MPFSLNYTKANPTPWGEPAWRPDDLAGVLSEIRRKSGVILGGDVITAQLVHTGDNWYYQPQWPGHMGCDEALRNNVEESVRSAHSYIRKYIQQNGTDVLFTFTTCSAIEALLRVKR